MLQLVELPLKEKLLLLIITAALDQHTKLLTQGAQGNQEGGVESLSERDMNLLKYMQKLTVMYQMLWVRVTRFLMCKLRAKCST